MRLKLTLLAMLLVCCHWLNAQSTPKDITIPVTATVSNSPLKVTLQFPTPTPRLVYIARRTKGDAGDQWIPVYGAYNSTITGLVDNTVQLGKTYEYFVLDSTTYYSFGYAEVAVQAPVVDSRGKILIFVDSTTADALGVELVRMKDDMRGDGWEPIPFHTGPSATPQSIKNQIVASYKADSLNVKAVLLFGRVPIPYSGDANWDGHPDHAGAWPCDAFYADIDGVWTDTLTDLTPGRVANQNAPGDGKFDQSYIPSPVELQVGRVDFRRLTVGTFGLNEIELLRRYLNKNHKWRTKQYTVDNKAIVDDNFGYFGGEAFAANGFRNAYPLVGESNIVEADFFNDTQNSSYLMGYGCGGGNYNGASGVGSSMNFGVDSVNIVFSNLFGSYFGDWDYETDPFMPSALASKGGILTCGWAGRPHYFLQALAAGETIGYAMKETQNTYYNQYYYGTIGASGAHVALLGDPTLRAHVVAPPANVQVTPQCSTVKITWTASADPNISGYHIYRGLSNNGPYTRLTTSTVTGTNYTDNAPPADTLYYQVRAIQTQTSPGGGIYTNNSTGPIASLVYVPGNPPVLSPLAGSLDCAHTSTSIVLHANIALQPGSAWTGPNGFTATGDSITVTVPGPYTVTTTATNGCTSSTTVNISQNINPPTATATGGTLTCVNQTVMLHGGSNAFGAQYKWTGPNSYTSSVQNPVVSVPGSYSVTVKASNGCTNSASTTVNIDTAQVLLPIPTTASFTCSTPCISLTVPLIPGYTFMLNGQPVQPGQLLNLCNAGSNIIKATSTANGCSHSYPLEVVANTTPPGATASISGDPVLSCSHSSVQLEASSPTSPVTYGWSGPNGFTSSLQNPVATQPGNYVVTVTNAATGCNSTAIASVNQDGNVPIVTINAGGLTCAVTSVTLTTTVNPANATVSWTGPNGFTSAELSPTVTMAGTYTVSVLAPNGCTTTASTNVGQNLTLPNITLPTAIDIIDCAHPCVTVQPTSTTVGVTILPIQACQPGPYTVQVTDPNNGCANSATFTVNNIPPLQVAVSAQLAGCNKTTFTAGATQGTGPYHYTWSTGETSPSVTVMAPTILSLTVTDESGCVYHSAPDTLVATAPIAITDAIVDESHSGAQDGSITLTVSGGTAPYFFQWNTGQSTQNLTGLPGDAYAVTVTDVNGCTSVQGFVVHTTVGTSEAAVFKYLELMPNPSDGPVSLHIAMLKSAPVSVSVYDATGRLVLDKPEFNATDSVVRMDLSNQPQGLYLISVRVKNQLYTRRLVINR